MPDKNVDDYLKQGIYGQKELNTEEKRKFLGTYRERVILALYIGQVAENNLYREVDLGMNQYQDSILLLNGSISYSNLSKYVKLSESKSIPHKIVTNLEHETDIGLVLASKKAIDKPDIYVIRDAKTATYSVKKKKSKGFFSFFRRFT